MTLLPALAGRDLHMATTILNKALVLTHPKSGLLSLEPESCEQQRLASLNNLSCAALATTKPHLGLQYANAALAIHKRNGHDSHTESQVRFPCCTHALARRLRMHRDLLVLMLAGKSLWQAASRSVVGLAATLTTRIGNTFSRTAETRHSACWKQCRPQHVSRQQSGDVDDIGTCAACMPPGVCTRPLS